MKHGSISNDSLYSYFNEKFSYDSSNESDLVKTLRRDVDIKRQNCNLPFDCFVCSEYNMVKYMYIKTLKSGCSAGYYGITSEHLKHALGSNLIGNLCYLFTYCFQFGVVPTNFTKGLLIPLLKKPSLDPTLCSNYRPIIVSTAFSKLAELCILDECNECTFSNLQFGFVKGRGRYPGNHVITDSRKSFFALQGAGLTQKVLVLTLQCMLGLLFVIVLHCMVVMLFT